MTTIATMIQNELAKEIQNVESENRRFQFFQADPLDGTDATPAGEAQVDVPDERNNNYREQTDEAGDEVWNEFRGSGCREVSTWRLRAWSFETLQVL